MREQLIARVRRAYTVARVVEPPRRRMSQRARLERAYGDFLPSIIWRLVAQDERLGIEDVARQLGLSTAEIGYWAERIIL